MKQGKKARLGGAAFIAVGALTAGGAAFLTSAETSTAAPNIDNWVWWLPDGTTQGTCPAGTTVQYYVIPNLNTSAKFWYKLDGVKVENKTWDDIKAMIDSGQLTEPTQWGYMFNAGDETVLPVGQKPTAGQLGEGDCVPNASSSSSSSSTTPSSSSSSSTPSSSSSSSTPSSSSSTTTPSTTPTTPSSTSSTPSSSSTTPSSSSTTGTPSTTSTTTGPPVVTDGPSGGSNGIGAAGIGAGAGLMAAGVGAVVWGRKRLN